MPFGVVELCGPNEPSRDQERTNPLAAVMGDKSAMWPFAKFLWAFVDNIITDRCSGLGSAFSLVCVCVCVSDNNFRITWPLTYIIAMLVHLYII